MKGMWNISKEGIREGKITVVADALSPTNSDEPDDGQHAVNDLGSVQFRTYKSCLLRFWRLGYSTAITSYETLEGDSEELKWARLSGASRFKEWGSINLFLWKGTGRRSGVVRLFRGSRDPGGLWSLGGLYCRGTGKCLEAAKGTAFTTLPRG